MMRSTVDDLDEERFRNDEVVRLAAVLMDPLYGKPVSPGKSAAQLIEIAEQQRRAAVRMWLWLGSPALVAVIVFAIFAAGRLLPAAKDTPTAPAPGSVGPRASSTVAPNQVVPLTLAILADPPPAHDMLVALSVRTAALPDPLPTCPDHQGPSTSPTRRPQPPGHRSRPTTDPARSRSASSNRRPRRRCSPASSTTSRTSGPARKLCCGRWSTCTRSTR